MLTLFSSALLALASSTTPLGDGRGYDVLHYDLNWRVEPAEKELAGTVVVRARVTAESLAECVLDLTSDWEVERIEDASGTALEFEHSDDQLHVSLAKELARDAELSVAVTYRGHPTNQDAFSGFHWAQTKDGRPWVNTSCQGPGAHSWWPCKSSYFDPSDKPDEGISVSLDVPEGLVGVSNGRHEGTQTADGRSVYRWRHPYPLETYSVTLNVAPYVVVEESLKLDGIDDPVTWAYYVLPENAEKAALQFQEMPKLLEVFSKAFGPWPFPESKVALVETNFWGMEHSTAVAYGSSYPAWCAENGAKDRYASRNKYFDYILVHEMAHEWWGNAVSAEHWGHFWIHEGFGTYAEAVWIEFTQGREVADEYFDASRRFSRRGTLYRGDSPSSGDAYSGLIYTKGAWVLNTLRYYLDDDELWWKVLRTFQLEQRYGNASSDDLRAVLERLSGRDWKQFFDEWVYGDGSPEIKGEITAEDGGIRLRLENNTGKFHVPIRLTGSLAGEPFRMSFMIEPGETNTLVTTNGTVSELEIENFHRVLGRHDVQVK